MLKQYICSFSEDIKTPLIMQGQNFTIYNLEESGMGAIIKHCCDQQFLRAGSSSPLPSSHSHKKSAPKVSPPSQKLQKQTSLQDILKIQMVEQPPDEAPIMEEDSQDCDIDQVIEETLATKPQFTTLTFSSFNVCGLLGEGSLGSVLQVELKQEVQHGIKQRYAMKRIHREKIVSHHTLASIKLQKQILSGLNNPFITTLKYAFSDPSYIYLVMEEASGGDVNSLVGNGRRKDDFKHLGYDGVKFIAASIVLGLEYLHSEHILYRDLKTENILLFSDGYAKLSDFGLAKIISHQDQLHKSDTGSILYKAPEMVLQQGYSKCVDFWALGILFYELATGETPFTIQELSSKTRFKRVVKEQEQLHIWRGLNISQQLKNLVAGLLRYKPEQRLGVKGWFQIKNHPFFNGFDWDSFKSKQMKSPLIGLIQKYPRSIKHFNHSEESKLESIDHLQTASDDTAWDFNYQSKGRRQ